MTCSPQGSLFHVWKNVWRTSCVPGQDLTRKVEGSGKRGSGLELCMPYRRHGKLRIGTSRTILVD